MDLEINLIRDGQRQTIFRGTVGNAMRNGMDNPPGTGHWFLVATGETTGLPKAPPYIEVSSVSAEEFLRDMNTHEGLLRSWAPLEMFTPLPEAPGARTWPVAEPS